jgi:hypothetical protein
MATRGVEMTVSFLAWDTAANAAKTGDSGNFTLRWIKDGTSSAPTNSVSEVDATNAPGIYKLTLTGGSGETDANIGTLAGKSSTASVSLIPTTIQFERLPDAAPGAASGVSLTSSVTDVETKVDTLATSSALSTVDTVVDAIKVVTDALPDSGALSSLATASALSTVDSNVDSILTDTGTTIPGTISTIDTVVDAIKVVTDALPDSGALSSLATASALATVDGNVDSILTDTGTTLPATLSTIEGKVDTVDTVVDSISSTLSSGVTVSTISDGAIGAAAVADIWSTTALAESYASDGSTGTGSQLLYQIQQALTEFAISSTTVTVKKIDGSTTASTYTLDDATTPTSRTRAS